MHKIYLFYPFVWLIFTHQLRAVVRPRQRAVAEPQYLWLPAPLAVVAAQLMAPLEALFMLVVVAARLPHLQPAMTA